MACGAADGSIILIKITQNIQQRSPLTPFGPEFDIHCDACVLDVKASESDKKAITALAWIKFPSYKVNSERFSLSAVPKSHLPSL